MTRARAARKSASDPEHGRHLLREMLRIRRFEERSAELYSAGKIRGFLHLYIGEEAVAVGAMQALTPEDRIVATYRDHGHALARGLTPGSLMAEMFGKSGGCSRGRGGSMHFFDVSRRFYGGYGIVGGGLPIAVGLGLADALQGRSSITACFFGDGAVAEGEFHESLNLAALWTLPVLFLYENNRYAMGTALDHGQSQLDMVLRARGYGIEAVVVDGMDVTAVEDATQKAAADVRAGQGPRLVEFQTYRFRAHSMSDPDLYRTKGEIEEWRERDPIGLLSQRLRAAGALDDELLAAMEAELERELAQAVEFAEASEPEPLSDLERDVIGAPA